MLNAFEGQTPETSFSLTQGGRESVLQAVPNGDLDAAILLGAADDEALFSTAIAVEVIAIIIHPSNPVENITSDALRRALTGRVGSWQELGGANDPLVVVTTPAGSSTRLALERDWLESGSLTPAARIAADALSLVQVVAATPNALGFAPLSSTTTDIRLLPIDGIAPTPQSARQRSYPLIVQVMFVSREEPDGFMRDFLEWILSRTGQQVVRRYMVGYGD